jgi:hypothetical protein
MEDTPVAKRFDLLCNSFHPVAEIGAMSDDSCNALIEELRTLRIKFSSNSSSKNNEEQLGTQEGEVSNDQSRNKTILSPIAVRCAGRPPSVRKESKVDKLLRQAKEKKKKAELKEKKKAAQEEKKKASQKVFLPILRFVQKH